MRSCPKKFNYCATDVVLLLRLLLQHRGQREQTIVPRVYIIKREGDLECHTLAIVYIGPCTAVVREQGQ